MTPETTTSEPKAPFGTLIDFIEGADKDTTVEVEVVVQNDGKVVVFHNKPFTVSIAWFEFDLSTNNLEFVMDGGEVRNIGLPLHEKLAKNMQNSHQILTILMDDESGEAEEGQFVPLIIHRG